MPMSIGCIRDVQLGGKNSTDTLSFTEISGERWAVKLSKIKTILASAGKLFPDKCRLASGTKWFSNHSFISCYVIHVHLFERYMTGNTFIFLKALGLSDFPITKNFILWLPAAFPHPKIVIRSLESFTPVGSFWPAVANVVRGTHRKNKPVSSAL
ncbi:hypothetical protein AVEN_1935-1 [Araneus ventricosus]|uniref:Uncharacterized protein n=1 Tax=Araneus ventricosus TaxID=182803 RepID=A0A4Y2GEV6_ARAVE|nr:hypothetical protein AVEN_1935-1 [Araneus ventricosus]